MDQKILTELSNDLSLYSRVLDSAGEQHSDRDISAIAYRLRQWVNQLESLPEETESPSHYLRDQVTE
jgi:hypothetical protein